MTHLITHVSDMVTLADGDFPNPSPKAPKGLDKTFGDWVAWAKWIAVMAGVLGLISCGIMMMVGRRNRSHLAAEGASGIVWVIAGISVASLAGGTVPMLFGA
ncbi:hypothetical protein AB0K09_02570 [Streptomyces sp. NPDC049577]|uniref:hypothetical protein n=1 Tax=Streptomyces sp. NPDC049577 TaxID=3155153 RepID=UPI0034271EB6